MIIALVQANVCGCVRQRKCIYSPLGLFSEMLLCCGFIILLWWEAFWTRPCFSYFSQYQLKADIYSLNLMSSSAGWAVHYSTWLIAYAEPALCPTNTHKQTCNAFHQYCFTYVQLIHFTEHEIHFTFTYLSPLYSIKLYQLQPQYNHHC